jgi:AP-1 complex subunit beta-1
MGCLRAEKIVDYLCDPLRKCLRDENPYVRKTAAICVVKFYDLKPDLCVENGFITVLQDLVGDSNPMVVANAVAALTEINAAASAAGGSSSSSSPSPAASSSPVFVLDSATLTKLLVALGECTEWGRIALLDAVAAYRCEDEREAETICERVVPQFQHANPSVVLAAMKVKQRTIFNMNLPILSVVVNRSLIPRTGHYDPFAPCYTGRVC